MVNIVQQNCQEKKLQDSCENPLSGGERRLQPSGVGPARLEQPTPTPLPRRGIKFIPRGAHFHALWCRPRRHGSAEEFCKVRVVRFIQVAMTKMGAEGKSPPHPVDRVSPQYRPVFHGFGKTLEVFLAKLRDKVSSNPPAPGGRDWSECSDPAWPFRLRVSSPLGSTPFPAV